MSDSRNIARISRRNLLRNATIAAGGGAMFAATVIAEPAEAANQISQAAAGYQPVPKNGTQCDICSLFQPPISCTLVQGNISAQGWCRYFTPRV